MRGPKTMYPSYQKVELGTQALISGTPSRWNASNPDTTLRHRREIKWRST